MIQTDDHRMSFGEHLEDLRSRILKSIFGVALLFLVGVFFQNQLLGLVAAPHQRAMRNLEANAEHDDARRWKGPYGAIRLLRDLHGLVDLDRCLRPEPEDPEAREAYRKKVAALKAFLAQDHPGGATLVATRYPEAFLTGIKAAFIFALLLGAPWTIYQLWMFVATGLYPHERKYVRLCLPVSLVLFLVGALFGYYVLIPFGLYFLGGLGNPDYVTTMITLGDYFSLFMMLTFALGVVFQLPLVMIALTLIGVTTSRTYVSKRRYFILGAFVVGAILTPPDPVTQLLMAGPILVLFELGIWGTRIIERASRKADRLEA